MEDEMPSVDMDAATTAPELIVSMVWKGQVLGFAFLSETVLRFGEVTDNAPDYRLLQACKYTMKPDIIICPSSSEQDWITALGLSSLVVPGTTLNVDADDVNLIVDAEDESEPSSAGGPRVVRCKNRDFNADACAKRLALLRTLSELPESMTESDVQMYLEHVCPREHEQARRAISGLLAYLQRAESGGAVSVLALRRYSLESQVYMSPECFISLHVFADERHPSAHGGRGKEGLSVWSVLNRTKTKPGEKLLRGWFSRPTQDLGTLHERHDALEFLTAPPHAQLLVQLHDLVGKMKDVTKLEASLSRGGLLLSDYSAVLATSSYAVKVAEMIVAAEVPTSLPFIKRAHDAIDNELYTVSNTIASVIDFAASSAARRHAIGAHIAVHDGVEPHLDNLRKEYSSLEPVLNAVAEEEQGRLGALGRLPPSGEIFIVYVAQLGFLLKLPLGEMLRPDEEPPAEAFDDPALAAQLAAEADDRAQAVENAYREAGLAFLFDDEGDWYFKSSCCEGLDLRYGDISSRVKDVEAQLVRHLELQLLRWLPVLRAAQSALAELDCLLALATSARELQLVKPTLIDDNGVAAATAIQLRGGWHPLLSSLGAVGSIVPNDCELGNTSERLMLLTGPNASGKTVYLRTVALCVYLAHIGSFVPAEAATLARTDAIYTRIHSKESAAVNQSAFMLDLSQMAHIFKHATSRSLCLIDEFGKGTNAQDGISLLYASLTELLARGEQCPRVIACTHYTELLQVPHFRTTPGLALWTMQVMVKEASAADAGGTSGMATIDGGGGGADAELDNDGLGDPERTSRPRRPLSAVLDEDVVFLYRASRGVCTDSFGRHCAAAADMPEKVITRARQVSKCRLEGKPIERFDVDARAAKEHERALAGLVDAFLGFNFNLGRPADFFSSVELLMERVVLEVA